MTAAMDKAMANMNVEKDEVTAIIPNLPEFSSTVDNINSLIGRVLNLYGVKMSSLILDLPRKWQKNERVRDIALSKERFQFFFQYEQ